MKAEINIALREFHSSIRSKRFVVTLASYLFMIFFFTYSIRDELIQRAGQAEVAYTSLPLTGVDGNMVITPLSLSTTSNLSTILIFGSILGITLGADSINREIEEGTIKVLLSHPLYRDHLIIGKFLGNALSLGLMISVGFVFSIAYLLLLGIPIDGASLIRSLIAAFVTLVYTTIFLSIGLAFSSILKRSEVSTLVAIVFVIFLILVYPLVSPTLASKLVGEKPYCPSGYNENKKYDNKIDSCIAMKEWEKKRLLWERRLLTLTPTYHYGSLITYVFSGDELTQDYIPLEESLSFGIASLLIFLTELILPLALAYIRFATMDLK